MAGLMGGLISLSISSIILVNVFISTVKIKRENLLSLRGGEHYGVDDRRSRFVGNSYPRCYRRFCLRNNERLRSSVSMTHNIRRGESGV